MTCDLKRELLDLIDLVHRLIGTGDDVATSRVVLDLPEGWRMLAAWLEMRRRMECGGKGGPSPLPVAELDSRTVRALVRSYIGFVLDNHFHLELHDLAMGGHPALRRTTVKITVTKNGATS